MTVRWKVTSLKVLNPDAGSSSGHEIGGGFCVTIPCTYSHALFFIVNGARRSVIPDTSLLNPSGYDTGAFIDLGVKDNDERYYELPADVDANSFLSGKVEITALLRKAYPECCKPSDVLPFSNVSAVKMACLSCVYEDENDLERAQAYMQYAIQELESDSSRFRGPQKMNISFADASGYEAQTNIY